MIPIDLPPAFPTEIAADLVCYQILPDGTVQDLSDLCGGGSGGSRHSFPTWLIDDEPFNDLEPDRTFSGSGEDPLVQTYQGRYIQTLLRWPYTLNPRNRAEWTWTDCQTGWTGGRWNPLAGTGSDWFREPGEAGFDVAAKCDRYGLTTEL